MKRHWLFCSVINQFIGWPIDQVLNQLKEQVFV